MSALYTRLSDTNLFIDMHAYYDKKGVEIWQDKLPCFVTTNRAFCHHYAHQVMALILDGLANQTFDIGHPIYILELGAGFGRFSYGMIQALLRLISFHELTALKLKYIISDVADKNLKLLQKHENLKALVAQNVLDFAKFDTQTDTKLHLINQNITLDHTQIKNPLILTCNYVLDTLKQDIFYVNDKQELFEVLVNYEKKPDWKLDSKQFTHEPFVFKTKNNACNSSEYYQEPLYNKILDKHCQFLKNERFLMPIGGLMMMKNLDVLTGGRYILLCADKGACDEETVEKTLGIDPAFHAGCCSFDVNFYALGLYANEHQGKLWANPIQISFSLYVLSMNVDLNQFKRAKCLFDEGRTSKSLYILGWVDKVADSLKMSEIIEVLESEYWEPAILDELKNRLVVLWPLATRFETGILLKKLEQVELNYFEIQVKPNVYLILGYIYTKIKEYQKAQPLLEKSLKLFPEDESPHALLKECAKALKKDYAPKAQKAIMLHTYIEPKSGELSHAREVFTVCWRAVISVAILFGVMYLFRA